MQELRLRRSIAISLSMGLLLLMAQGCTRFDRGPAGFISDRLRDALEMGDLGVTATSTPQISLYTSFFSMPAGYGAIDGTFTGIGFGDIGSRRIHYRHIGLVAWGREVVGVDDGVLFRFGPFDPERPETMDAQGVGIIGFVTPPFDARPAGRPA